MGLVDLEGFEALEGLGVLGDLGAELFLAVSVSFFSMSTASRETFLRR